MGLLVIITKWHLLNDAKGFHNALYVYDLTTRPVALQDSSMGDMNTTRLKLRIFEISTVPCGFFSVFHQLFGMS